MAVITIPYKPRDAFKPLHGRTTRWACVVAHRRAGKTVACINDLIRAALTTDKRDFRGAYVAPFFVQAKSVAWDYIKYFSGVVPGVRFNEAELRVDYPNGARIQLFGADNADRLRGLYFDALIADEYGDWKPSVWNYVIRPALADRNGWAIIIGTPKGRNAFYDRMKLAMKSPDWLAMTLRASESGILSSSELEAMRAEMSEEAWLQEMECDFDAAIPGAIYGREVASIRQLGRVTSIEADETVPVYTAWDLGYSDDTSIWWFQVVHGEVRFLDFHSSNGENLDYYIELIKSKGYKYGRQWLPHDARAKTLASGGKSIEEQMAKHFGWGGISIVPSLSLQDGIQAARQMLASAWFDHKCEAGLDALSLYQREWDDEKKIFRPQPRHDWTSHAADAFRMAAIAYREEPKPRPTEPPKFWHQQTISELIEAQRRKRLGEDD